MIINAEIPDSLYQEIESLSRKENIAINELINIALSNQIAMGKKFLEEKGKKGSWEDIKNILAQVSSAEPQECDRL